MSQVNTYGWEFKKPNLGAEKPLDFSKSADAADVPTNKGKTKISKEKGDN